MSSHFAKPENALRKAKDLVSAGKESSALRTLHAILTSKRYRTWQATHEKIMQRYIELAIDLRRPVKDALIQYRSICHQQNLSSLEKMIRKYRRMAEDRASKAEADSENKGVGKEKTSLLEGRDVELDDTPESIMLQAITGEDKGDRAGRQVLLPWVKYLWDTYRTILEVIRNNARLEPLYHATVRQAFDFCRHYRRNVEFRHLCDILRQHLTGIAKHQLQTNAVDLQAGETQRLYLETRFEQLRVASELELWQEAYRTIEDIHENMRLSTSTPKPALMTVYYDKLSRIFWASDNHLFHAYSLSKYFTLAASIKAGSESKVDEKEVKSDSKAKKDAEEEVKDEVDRKLPEVKELTAEERKRWATAVVLATLVIPAGERFEHEGLPSAENEGNLRLANLLGFKKETPTRARLLQNVATSILADASVEAQKAFDLLENKFGPLTLNAQIAPLLDGFEKDELLSKYVPALKNLTVIRLLKQLSSVYKTMRMDKFLAIAPKLAISSLERLVMSAVRADQLQLRWDHRAQLVHFSEEGMESQRVKEQLFALAQRLQKVVEKISPPSATAKAAERKDVYARVRSGVDAEHKEVFVRRNEIENRKREAERVQDEKEKSDQLAKIRETNEKKAEEKKRLEYEQKKRSDERIKAEREQHEMEQKKKLADDLARFATKGVSNTKQGKAAAAMLENLQHTKKEALALAQAQLIETEKKETEKKRRERARQHDYLIRALRMEEKDLLVKAREHQLKADSEAIEEDFHKFEEQHKVAHARAMEEKERLARMTKHKEVFFQQIIARRQRELEDEMAAKAKVEKQKAEERAKAEERRRLEVEALQRESDERLRKEQVQAEKMAAEAAAAAAASKTDDSRGRPVFRNSALGATGVAKPLDTRSAASGPRRGLQAPITRGPAGATPVAEPVAAREPVRSEREPVRSEREPVRGSEREAPSPSQGNADEGPWRRAGDSGRAAPPARAPRDEGERSADGVWRPSRGPSSSAATPAPAAASPVPSSSAAAGSDSKWRRDTPATAPTSGGAPAAAAGSESGPWRRSGGSSAAPPAAASSAPAPTADGAREWRGSTAGPFASSGGASRFNRGPDDREPRTGGPPSRGFGGGGSRGGFSGNNSGASDRTEGTWERRGPASPDQSAPPAASPSTPDDGFRPAGGARRGFGGGARGGR